MEHDDHVSWMIATAIFTATGRDDFTDDTTLWQITQNARNWLPVANDIESYYKIKFPGYRHDYFTSTTTVGELTKRVRALVEANNQPDDSALEEAPVPATPTPEVPAPEEVTRESVESLLSTLIDLHLKQAAPDFNQPLRCIDPIPKHWRPIANAVETLFGVEILDGVLKPSTHLSDVVQYVYAQLIAGESK